MPYLLNVTKILLQTQVMIHILTLLPYEIHFIHFLFPFLDCFLKPYKLDVMASAVPA